LRGFSVPRRNRMNIHKNARPQLRLDDEAKIARTILFAREGRS
jgi:hypothetical protein